MMNGAKDLLQSERGALCIGALIAATILAAMSKIDGVMWLEFAKWLCAALIASKTVTTAVETVTLKTPQIPSAIVVPKKE